MACQAPAETVRELGISQPATAAIGAAKAKVQPRVLNYMFRFAQVASSSFLLGGGQRGFAGALDVPACL